MVLRECRFDRATLPKAEFITSYDTARVRLKKKTSAIANLEQKKRFELTHGALLSVITEQKLNSNNL